MSNILDHVPQPLLGNIVSGKCIPIIGASFSKNAIISSEKKMPNWFELGEKQSWAKGGRNESTIGYQHHNTSWDKRST